MECVVYNQMCAYFHVILDVRLPAFRKNYNTQSILVKAVETWRKAVEHWIKALDNGTYVGAILMDLSKAFDVILHGLFLAKLHAYVCDTNVNVNVQLSE